jgi:hypothetical protein
VDPSLDLLKKIIAGCVLGCLIGIPVGKRINAWISRKRARRENLKLIWLKKGQDT